MVELSNGEKKRKTVYGDTRREVEQKISQLQVEVTKGTYIETPNITVKEYLTKWVTGLDSVRPSTKESYAGVVRLYILPHLGDLRPAKLRPLEIQGMLQKLKKIVSSRTCQYTHSILRKALQQAI